jgi:glycosyltransferase involved in cell wall biosynthesis
VLPIGSNPTRRRFSLAFNATTKLPAKVLASIGKAELFHATDPSSALGLPTFQTTSIVTIHDLMPLLSKIGSHYTQSDRIFATLCYGISAKCDSIIAVSEQTKREFTHSMRVSPRRVTVVHHGISETFRDLRLERGKVVGYVGDINPRKRIDLLIKAFGQVRSRHPDSKLLIIGKNIAEYLSVELQLLKTMVTGLGLQDSVIFVGHVSDIELVRLYNSMKVLVMPSEYEGFGFPILEAQRCGTPVIVRNGARISEEISRFAAHVDSTEDLADEISLFLSSPRHFADFSEAGLLYSRTFTWENCVSSTVSVYQAAVSRR